MEKTYTKINKKLEEKKSVHKNILSKLPMEFNSKKNYREEIMKSGLTWKIHVDKLLEIWKK